MFAEWRYSVRMETLEKVRELAREFMIQHEKAPSTLFLTRADESALSGLSATDIGDDEAMEKLIKDGPRVAFARLRDMRVIWESDETRVQ
jgi:hypothetical protein